MLIQMHLVIISHHTLAGASGYLLYVPLNANIIGQMATMYTVEVLIKISICKTKKLNAILL